MYVQKDVLKKINSYLSLKKRCDLSSNPLQLQPGYCHGFTLLWLRKMIDQKEESFYQSLDTIMNTPDPQLGEIEATFEEIIPNLHWAQKSTDIQDEISQCDIEQLIQKKRLFTLS